MSVVAIKIPFKRSIADGISERRDFLPIEKRRKIYVKTLWYIPIMFLESKFENALHN